MKLLLIEDNEAVVMALRRGLRAICLIDVATSGKDGLYGAEVGDYDVMVLDLALPDISGLEVCRVLRSQRHTTPILALTGQTSVQHKVAMLDAGADDYMTKPFSLEELKARLRVLMRRDVVCQHSSILRVHDLTLSLADRRVERAAVPIHLRRKEYALLEYLMHNAGKVVTRAMIIDHVWDVSDTLWTNAVDVHIKYLRDKIERPFAGPVLITTVHGVGYKLEAFAALAAMGA